MAGFGDGGVGGEGAYGRRRWGWMGRRVIGGRGGECGEEGGWGECRGECGGESVAEMRELRVTCE